MDFVREFLEKECIKWQDMENSETSPPKRYELRYPSYKHAITWQIEKFSEDIFEVKVSPDFQVEPLSSWCISLTRETSGIGLYLHRCSEERNFQVFYTVEVSDAENNMLHYYEKNVLPSTDNSRFGLMKNVDEDRMNKIVQPVGDALTIRMRIEAVRI